jgi:sugar-phosphatase
MLPPRRYSAAVESTPRRRRSDGANWPQTFTPERAETAVTQTAGTYRWQSVSVETFLGRLIALVAPGEVAVFGIDGRSRSGKTSLAAELGARGDDMAIIHTDDIAWHHSFFDWTPVLITGVLEPLRRDGPPVSFTPQAWIDRGRSGSIDIPRGTQVVLVEGVGAARAELTRWLDATIWVETPEDVATRRTVELDRDPPGFIDDWMRAERAHLDRDRPWTRATVITSGTHRPGPTNEMHANFGDGIEGGEHARTFRVDGILFDSDGVLVDSNEAAALVWNDWARKWCPGFDFHRDIQHGRRLQDIVADLVDAHHVTSATQALSDMEMASATGVPSIAGVPGLLAAMPADSWAVVTSGRRAMALARLASAGLPRPRVVVAAEDVAAGKPAPEPYLAGAHALDLEPHHCAVFEDAPLGIRSARAAGAKVVIGVGAATIAQDVDVTITDLSGVTFDGRTLTIEHSGVIPPRS